MLPPPQILGSVDQDRRAQAQWLVRRRRVAAAGPPVRPTDSVIVTSTHTVTAACDVGNAPTGATAAPDGARLCVANTRDNTFSVIDTGAFAGPPLSTSAIPRRGDGEDEAGAAAGAQGDSPRKARPTVEHEAADAGPDGQMRAGGRTMSPGRFRPHDLRGTALLNRAWDAVTRVQAPRLGPHWAVTQVPLTLGKRNPDRPGRHVPVGPGC